MLSFEGNTAPYLQYAYSRIRAIFRKAKDPSLGDIKITCDAEEDLANKLLAFAEAVQSVGDKTLPNLLCNYILSYQICSCISMKLALFLRMMYRRM